MEADRVAKVGKKLHSERSRISLGVRSNYLNKLTRKSDERAVTEPPRIQINTYPAVTQLCIASVPAHDRTVPRA